MRLIRVSILATVVLIALSILAPASALAGEGAETTVYDAEVATASFTLGDDPCVKSYVSLAAATRTVMVNDDSPDQLREELAIVAYFYDTCQKAYVMYGSERVPATGLEIGEGLNRATLRQSVDMYDWSNDTRMTVTLDLAWEATGMPERVHHTFVYSDDEPGPGVIVRASESYNYKSRQASAGGTITFGSTSFAATQTLAQLYGVQTADVFIGFEE